MTWRTSAGCAKRSATPAPVHPDRRTTAVAESAEIIRRAALFIGIDSGPAHLADAVKTPGVILLGRYLTWDYYMPYTGFYAERGIAVSFDTQGRPAIYPWICALSPSMRFCPRCLTPSKTRNVPITPARKFRILAHTNPTRQRGL